VSRRIKKADIPFFEETDKQDSGDKPAYVRPESHSAAMLPSRHAAAQELKKKPDPQNKCCRDIQKPDEEKDKNQRQHPSAGIENYIGSHHSGNRTAGTNRRESRPGI
jgi:hypothetical protein